MLLAELKIDPALAEWEQEMGQPPFIVSCNVSSLLVLYTIIAFASNI